MNNNSKTCSEAAFTSGKVHYGPLGNVFFRAMIFEKLGDTVAGHTHNYDHVTFLWRGSLKLRAWHASQEKDGVVSGDVVERTYTAPSRILIKRDWCHELTSLEENTSADCIFAIRDVSTGEIAEDWDGSLEPYV